MAIQVPNLVNAFLQGRQARSQMDQDERKNALLDMQIANAPQEQAQRNKLLELQTRGVEQDLMLNRQKAEAEQTGIADKRKQGALKQVGIFSQQALASPDPRGFVAAALANPQYAEIFSAAGIDPVKAQEGLNSPDFERNLQIAATMGDQVSANNRFDAEEAQKQREFTARENAATRANQLQLANTRNQPGTAAPSGYRYTPDGSLQPIPGGPADPSTGKNQAIPTEGERKSAALGTRLDAALQSLQALEQKDPGVSRPGIGEKLLGVAGEAPANYVRSSNRQQADAAQLDALDAALTLATGAAYTKEQLQSLRKAYFPQLGDSDETAKAKQKTFETIVKTARISAGRAAPNIDEALGRGAGDGRPKAPPAALEFLKANPQYRGAFKAKYGYLP